VNSPLSGIPIETRRRMSATLGLFAVLFVAVGVVATTGATPAAVRVFSAVALIVAAILGTVAWGVTHSVKLDLREGQLDNAIERAVQEAVADHGGPAAAPCGHHHEVDELLVSDDEPGRRYGSCPVTETDCVHSCDTCLLASLRPSPTRSRAQRLAQEGANSATPPGANR
jgi:hypothetical protein